jgi:hypothetical protein
VKEREAALDAADLTRVWDALTAWDQRRARVLDLPGCQVRLYMGAMEIPMLALEGAAPVSPVGERLATWQPALDRFGLVLDCVTPDANYKLNRRGSGEYVGRILPDALKFHAERLIDLGPEALETLGPAYLALPAERPR